MAANATNATGKLGIFGEVAKETIAKKEDLITNHFAKFAYRSILATMFLTLGTAAALTVAQIGENIAPGLGKMFFAFMFSWSLVIIVYMSAELTTANMMFMTIGVDQKYISLGKGIEILFVCTLFNLIGGVIFSWVLAQTTAFQNLPADHFLVTTIATKMAKSPLTLFLEGIFANIVVTTAVIASNRMVNGDGRAISIIFIIFIFALLGDEHVIANFVLFPLTYFCGLAEEAGLTIGGALFNWLIVWIGNYVGGGLIIGLGYSWLNKNERLYVD
ncbi:MAG: formate/nitrite transporter family protein [Aerococcus sp.]|nr:formate/nitrite transporter family protein [Aerococcus sp.]